jgi:hypothetical protein
VVRERVVVHTGHPAIVRATLWRRHHGNRWQRCETTSGTALAIPRGVIVVALAFVLVTLFAVAISITGSTHYWWIPSIVVIAFGVVLGATLIRSSHGHGLDGFGIFLTGVVLGSLTIVFGALGLAVSAWLHLRATR